MSASHQTEGSRVPRQTPRGTHDYHMNLCTRPPSNNVPSSALQ